MYPIADRETDCDYWPQNNLNCERLRLIIQASSLWASQFIVLFELNAAVCYILCVCVHCNLYADRLDSAQICLFPFYKDKWTYQRQLQGGVIKDVNMFTINPALWLVQRGGGILS